MVKKRTKAQTPAPKKDRIKGSKTNPKGSASGSRGGIKISDEAVKSLENMRDKHNARFTKSSRRVDLGKLKAVFRRGAGAFSTSHRPGMNRNQWAFARVRAFLKLVATGQRKKAYTTDLDLLPSGHPQKTEKKSEQLAPKKYDHIDFKPPKGVQDAAARALEVRASKPASQRGMTDIGIARARDLKAGKTLSPETVKRMLAYFTRHEVDKTGSTWKDQGKGWQAWHGWGGDAGFSWSRKIVKQMKSADEKSQSLTAYTEAIQLNDSSELITGKPFLTLGVDQQVCSRMSGEPVGKPITQDTLKELVRVFEATKESSPVIIDWQHATSPYSDNIATPETGNALGKITSLEIRDDGLYAYPEYTSKGAQIVQDAEGVLWSSPEFLVGEVYDRNGGELIGQAQMLAITLTPRPAQSHDQISTVRLNESEVQMDNDQMSIDELRAALEAKDELVKQLEAQIKEMKADNENAMKSEELEEKEDEKSEKLEEKKDKDHNENKEMKRKEYTEDTQAVSTLSESNVLLFKEIQTLKEQVDQLQADKAKALAEKAQIQMESDVTQLLNEGKISVAERSTAEQAWLIQKDQPIFWQMFSERQPNQSVNLESVGHGASGQEISKKALNERVQALSEEKKVSYSQALALFRTSNPDYYNSVYGG